jgi:hypothetical protein
MWHVWGRGEVHTGLWWGKLGKRPLLNLGMNKRMVLKVFFEKENVES